SGRKRQTENHRGRGVVCTYLAARDWSSAGHALPGLHGGKNADDRGKLQEVLGGKKPGRSQGCSRRGFRPMKLMLRLYERIAHLQWYSFESLSGTGSLTPTRALCPFTPKSGASYLLFFKLYHCRSLDSFQNHWPIIYTSAFENPALRKLHEPALCPFVHLCGCNSQRVRTLGATCVNCRN